MYICVCIHIEIHRPAHTHTCIHAIKSNPSDSTQPNMHITYTQHGAANSA